MRQWEPDAEDAAKPFAAARGLDGTSVHLDQILDDCQAEAQPAVVTRRRCVTLAEALEDVRQDVGGNALTRVAHVDLHVAVDLAQHDLDAAAARRELDGVAQQVPDDLLQPARIALDDCGRAEHFRSRTPLASADGCAEGTASSMTDATRPLDVESQLSGHDAADVEQVVDDLRLAPRVAVDDVNRLVQRFGRLLLLEHADLAQNGVQGRSQLVRQRSDEIVLHASGALGF